MGGGDPNSESPAPRGREPDSAVGPITGVWKEQLSNSTAAAKASSSFEAAGRIMGDLPVETALPALGRGGGREGRWLGKTGAVGALAPDRKPEPAADWNDREYDPDPEKRLPAFAEPVRMPRGVAIGPESVPLTGGGGVVSSDEELSFVEEVPSLLDAPDEEAGGVGFIDTKIEAASSSCTC